MSKINSVYLFALLGARHVMTLASASEKKDKTEIAVKNMPFYGGEGANNLYSVSKSTVSLALGFLYDEGKINPQDKVEKYLGKYFPENVDDGWHKVTLNDLFHHTTGSTQDVDFDLVDGSTWEDSEWLHVLFSYPNQERIGQDWRYSDGNYYILGRVVREITGQNVFDFLNERLFSKTGFSYHNWARDKRDDCLGGTGLFLRVRDLAKIGMLWKNKGVYDGVRYLSEEWITLCTTPHDSIHKYGFGVRKHGKEYTITGMNGQGIWFSEDCDTVFCWESSKGAGLAGICSLLHKLKLI